MLCTFSVVNRLFCGLRLDENVAAKALFYGHAFTCSPSRLPLTGGPLSPWLKRGWDPSQISVIGLRKQSSKARFEEVSASAGQAPTSSSRRRQCSGQEDYVCSTPFPVLSFFNSELDSSRIIQQFGLLDKGFALSISLPLCSYILTSIHQS